MNKIRNLLGGVFFRLQLWVLGWSEAEFNYEMDFRVLYQYLPEDEAKRLLEKEYGREK